MLSGSSPGKSTDASAPRLFDAHCHLQDDRFKGLGAETLLRAKQNRVTAMMCCGCSENDWDGVLQLSGIEGLFVSFGLHPWYVRERTARWLDHLQGFLDSVPNAGVGEIGLDHVVEADPAQEEVFIQQLRLARRLGRPVSIHCRRAFGRTIELLENEGGATQGGLIHSYSGSVELVPVFERLGLYMSFSGAITRSNNGRTRQAIAAVSKNRLLIETDSPDLPPAGAAAGTRNEPANLPLVLEAAARLIGLTVRETAALTFDNARRLFGEIPPAR